VCVIAQRYADYALKQFANDIIKLPTDDQITSNVLGEDKQTSSRTEVRRRTCPRAFQGD
jgi:hypothetical protein